MSFTLPYNDKLDYNNRAFIKPNGEIIFISENHEEFAKSYCIGEKHQFLSNFKNLNNFDAYQSTKLTKDQFLLFKQWLEKYEFSKRELFSDFIVCLLSFDKVETIRRKTITTTNSQPHIRFYNYYLMDWNIEEQKPMKYNPKNDSFEYEKNENWLIKYNEDRAVSDEILNIKAKVKIKDRPLFFK